MNSKFYIFALCFTLSLLCSFPSWSVTCKITRLLLDDKQIVFLHDCHTTDYESALQRDALLEFIENAKAARVNISLILEKPNDLAKEADAKMNSSAIGDVAIMCSVAQPLKAGDEVKKEIETIVLINSLTHVGTAADWRVPFFSRAIDRINKAKLLKVRLQAFDQKDGAYLFIDYLTALEKILLETLASHEKMFRKYGRLTHQIMCGNKVIKLGQPERIIVEFLVDLNDVIRPKYMLFVEQNKHVGFLSASSFLMNHSEDLRTALDKFFTIKIADVGFYLQILKDLEEKDVVIVAAGSDHCDNLIKELKAIGARERGAEGLTNNEIKDRLKLRIEINSANGLCTEDDFEEIAIALKDDDYRGLLKKVLNFESKSPRERCAVCDESNKLLKCSRCKEKFYCSEACQREDWPEHRKTCQPR